MSKTHKQFSARNWSLREARLIAKDAGHGQEMKDRYEGPHFRVARTREEVEFVTRALLNIDHARNDFPQKDKARVEKMLSDPYVRNMILASVRQTADGRVEWISPEMQQFVRKFHEAFTSAPGKLEAQLGKASKVADKFFEQVNTAEKILADLIDPSDTSKKVTLPAKVESAKKILTNLKESRLKGVPTMHVLVKTANAAIVAAGEGYPQGPLIDAIRTEPLLSYLHADLLGVFDDPLKTFTTGQRDKILGHLLSRGIFGPTDEENKILEEALAAIENALSDADVDRRKFLIDKFPKQAQFYNMLVGKNSVDLVRSSFANDGKFSFELFAANLKALDKNISTDVLRKEAGLENEAVFTATFAKNDVANSLASNDELGDPGIDDVKHYAFLLLTQGRDALQKEVNPLNGEKLVSDEVLLQLISVWNTDRLTEFLREKHGVDTHNLSLLRLHLRARLTPDMVKTLADAGLDKEISVGTLYRLAKIQSLHKPGPVTDEEAESAILIFSDLQDDIYKVRKDDFLEVVTFLFLKSADKKGGAEAKAAAALAWEHLQSLKDSDGKNVLAADGVNKNVFEVKVAYKSVLRDVLELQDSGPRIIDDSRSAVLQSLKNYRLLPAHVTDVITEPIARKVAAIDTLVEKGELMDEEIDALLEIFTSPPLPARKVHLLRPQFIEVITALALRGSTVEDVNKAKTIAIDLWHCLKDNPSVIFKEGDEFVLQDKDFARDQLRRAVARDWTSRRTEKPVSELLQKLDESNKANLTWDKNLKLYTREVMAVSGDALDKWWERMKELPGIFTMDKELLSILNRQNALKDAKKAIKEVQEIQKKTRDATGKIFTTLSEHQKEREDALKPIEPSGDPLKHLSQAKLLLRGSLHVYEHLSVEPFWTRANEKTRQIAFHIGLNFGVDNARSYLANPDAYAAAHPDHVVGAGAGYLDRVAKNNVLQGKDVLAEMKRRLGVSVSPKAWPTLLHTRGSNGLQLAIGPTALSQWLVYPAASREALEAILIEENGVTGGKAALIAAFSQNPGGATINFKLHDAALGAAKDMTLDPAQAQQFIQDIIQHLTVQAERASTSREQLLRDERNTNPLDVLRTGVDTLQGMLQSGDKVEQALAIGMIVGAGYLITRMWKAGGWKRELLVGLPMFFGADIILKKMTGQGLMDRLNLNYMNVKDRNSTLEQFVRGNEKKDKYKFMKTEAGYEAVRQIMNPTKRMPLKALLAWRSQIVPGNYGRTLPQHIPEVSFLNDAVGAVAGKIGALDGRNKSPAILREQAYGYIYLAFEALCEEVAIQNGESEPLAEKGAHLIRERYVDMNATYMVDFKEGFHAVEKSCGGYFSPFDVLCLEMKTPSMQEAFANESWTEWLRTKIGVGADTVEYWAKRGYSRTAILSAFAVGKLPDAYEATKEFVVESTDWLYDHLGVVYAKFSDQAKKDLAGTWEFIKVNGKDLGIYIKKVTPDVVEWGLDAGVAVKNFTLSRIKDLYRALGNNAITGPLRNLVDEMCKLVFGATLTRLIVLEATVKDESERVKKLAERPAWKNDLQKYITSFIAVPDAITINDKTAQLESHMDDWLVKAANLLGHTVADSAAFDVLPAQKKMAVYEYVKRNVYSLLIAKRIEALQKDASAKFPLPPDEGMWNWDLLGGKNENNLAQAFVHTYDPAEILKFIGREKNTYGLREVWLDASEYTKHPQLEYLFGFIEEAKKTLGPGTPLFDEYKAYLNTVLANALIEITLGGIERERDKKGEPKVDGSLEPLSLHIRNAKEFLEYLKITRASSPRIETLKTAPNPLEKGQFRKVPGAEQKALDDVKKDEKLLKLIGASEHK